MKWILYLLVLANAAFFAWQYQLRVAVRAASEAREAARPAYVTRLVLLSEAPERSGESGAPGTGQTAEERPTAASPAAAGLEAASPEAASPEAAGPVAARPAAASPAEEPKPDGAPGMRDVPAPVSPVAVPLPTPAPVTASVLSAAAPPVGPAAAPSPGLAAAPSAEPATAPPVVSAAAPPVVPPAAPAPSLPPTGEPAGLLRGETALDPAGRLPAPPAATVAEVAEPRRCYRVGPLAEDAPVDPVRTWLAQHGGEVQSRVEQRQEPRSFWVYLPPAPSAQAAREAADRLQAEGVKDVMRVTAGAKANAISLGLYNRRAAADQRVSELKRAGYAAEVETRFKEVRETWLDATFAGPKAPPREALRAAFPQVQVVDTDCP